MQTIKFNDIEIIDNLDGEIRDLIITLIKENKTAEDAFIESLRMVDKYKGSPAKNINKDVNIFMDNYNEAFQKYRGTNVSGIPRDEVRYQASKNILQDRTLSIYDTIPNETYKRFVNVQRTVTGLLAAGDLSLDQAIRVSMSDFNDLTITFKDGTNYPTKAYIRMIYKTEYANLSRARGEEIGDSLGAKVYQVNSHPDPRDFCSLVQGGLISFVGVTSFKDGYGKVHKVKQASVANYGSPDGLGGINCAHNWFPVLDGISKINKLKTFDNKDIGVNL